VNFISLDRDAVGVDLKRAREHLRLSLSEVADLSGVAASHIWHLEKGNKNVSLDLFVLVCASLGLPPAQLLNDNLLVRRQPIFERAVEELGGIDEAKSDEQASEKCVRLLLAADYAAGCSVILSKSIVAGNLSGQGWRFPTKGIEDAFGVVFMRLGFDGLSTRWEYLRSIGKKPVALLAKLGLWTNPLLEGFMLSAASVAGKDKSLRPWIPVQDKGQEHFYTALTNPMSAIDPQSLGSLLRDLSEHTATAPVRSAIQFLKRKKKRNK
jgi:transcriptional regulator with XRE-family HTH domain